MLRRISNLLKTEEIHFKCPFCQKIFQNWNDFEPHIQTTCPFKTIEDKIWVCASHCFYECNKDEWLHHVKNCDDCNANDVLDDDDNDDIDSVDDIDNDDETWTPTVPDKLNRLQCPLCDEDKPWISLAGHLRGKTKHHQWSQATIQDVINWSKQIQSTKKQTKAKSKQNKSKAKDKQPQQTQTKTKKKNKKNTPVIDLVDTPETVIENFEKTILTVQVQDTDQLLRLTMGNSINVAIHSYALTSDEVFIIAQILCWIQKNSKCFPKIIHNDIFTGQNKSGDKSIQRSWHLNPFHVNFAVNRGKHHLAVVYKDIHLLDINQSRIYCICNENTKKYHTVERLIKEFLHRIFNTNNKTQWFSDNFGKIFQYYQVEKTAEIKGTMHCGPLQIASVLHIVANHGKMTQLIMMDVNNGN